MKPSSKIGPLALMTLAALWPTAGAAGPSAHAFGAPRARHVFVPAMHAMHPGRTAIGLEGRFSRRFEHASFAYDYAYAWPGFWPGTLPGYYAHANAEVGPPPAFAPPFYPLPGATPFATCRKPLVIKIAREKPRHDLPRVIYGTPSFCPG
ncbi:MAG: hypothetical protein ACLPID_20240 [Beijerinckiaceae bacterium]